jgi:hypothetical protein
MICVGAIIIRDKAAKEKGLKPSGFRPFRLFISQAVF